MAKEWKEETLEDFKRGLWEFVMDHCDVMPSGALFVKFHIDDRQNLENRIKGRWLHHYNRNDPEKRNAQITGIRSAAEEKKRIKKERYDANRRKGKKKQFWNQILKFMRIKK